MMVNPTGVAVAGDGMVYVADPDAVPEEEGGRLLRVDPSTGEQSVVTEPGLLVRPAGVAVDGDGTLLVTDMLGRLVRVDPGSGAQTLISSNDQLWGAQGIAVEDGGTAVVAVEWVGIVRVDLATGEQSLLAEADGIDMISPADVEVSPDGVVYVADPFSYDVGAILHDPVSGDVLIGYMGNPGTGYRNPRGLELKDIALNVADVTADTTDPNPDNNLAFAGVEVVDSGVPQPVEIVVVEQVGVTDTSVAGPLPPVVITVTEGVIVSDTVNSRPTVFLTITEQVGVTDTSVAGPLPPVVIAVTEGIAVSDTVNPRPTVFLAITEQVGVTDTSVAGPLPPVEITVTEGIAVSDAVNPRPAVFLVVTEQVGVADQVVVRPAVFVVVNEAVYVADVDLVQVGEDEPPRVDWIGTVAGASGEHITAAVTQVLLRFSERVGDPPGDNDPDDVTNPDNQLLLTDGGDGVFQTVDCATGVDPADLLVAVHQVLYLDDLQLSAAQLGDRPLPASRYRLYVCGTTSIVDLNGNPLDGDGDGQGGDDLVVEFEVTADNLLANPNYDADLEHWTVTAPGGTQVEHDDDDVDDAPTSGSARLANLGSIEELALGQCAAVPGDGWYRFGGRMRMDLVAPGDPSPRLELQWFGQPGCQQPISEVSRLQLRVPEQGLWPAQEHFVRAPSGSASARFTLATATDPGEDHETRWDSAVFFRDATVVFADGFESGDALGWDGDL